MGAIVTHAGLFLKLKCKKVNLAAPGLFRVSECAAEEIRNPRAETRRKPEARNPNNSLGRLEMAR